MKKLYAALIVGTLYAIAAAIGGNFLIGVLICTVAVFALVILAAPISALVLSLKSIIENNVENEAVEKMFFF